MPRISPSVLGILGSVKSRNFVPVRDWKTVSLKKLDSRLSMPVTGRSGFGYRKAALLPTPFTVAGGGSSEEEAEYAGNLGVRFFVMAWTPWNVPARIR